MMLRRRPTAGLCLALALGLGVGACDSDADDPIAVVDPSGASTTITTAADTTSPPPSSETSVADAQEPTPLVGSYVAEVVQSIPHDPTAYTQGLEWYDGVLLESTGQYGASTLRRIDPASGAVVDEVALDPVWFGEGLTVVGDQVWQLTWREGVLVRSSADDLERIDTATYEGEGWGLCLDDDRLVMSDGSNLLTLRDPTTFEVVGSVFVSDASGPLGQLNELECRAGQVLANVYGSDTIAAIDIDTGSVVATIDASGLRPAAAPVDDLDFVLNGIAARPGSDRLYLTGKYWPTLYEVELAPSGG